MSDQKPSKDVVSEWDEALDWVLRINSSPDDQQLKSALSDWLSKKESRRQAYGRAERVWSLTGDLPARHIAPAEASRRRLEARCEWQAARPTRQSARQSMGRAAFRLGGSLRQAAIAATLLLALCALYLVDGGLMDRPDFRTASAERRQVELSDGSVVDLAPRSAISVEMSRERRRILLHEGQAFVSVAPSGIPFALLAETVVLRDIGTSFDAKLRDGELETSVRDGLIELSDATSPGHKAERLGPGDRLRLDLQSGQMVRDEVDPETVGAWRDGRLWVENETIASVIDRIRPYFGGWIVLQGSEIAQRKVSGIYNLNDPVNAIVAVGEPHAAVVRKVAPFLIFVTTF